MPLSLQDMASKGLIGELAEIYSDADSATILLLAAGYPPDHIPEFVTARSFWLTVCRTIATGANPNAFEPLLARAAQEYPHSQHFGPYAQPAQHTPVAQPDDTESRHHYLLVQGVNDIGALLQQARALAPQHEHEPGSIQYAFANREGVFLETTGWEFEQVVVLGNALYEQHQEYHTSVSTTAFHDYMLHQLFVEGPDQQRYEINSIRASTPIRDVVQGVASNFYKGTASAMRSGRTVAVDLQSKSGESRRVNANDTLHNESVQDGDTLEMHPETRAGPEFDAPYSPGLLTCSAVGPNLLQLAVELPSLCDLELHAEATELLFQCVARLYAAGAAVLTSNPDQMRRVLVLLASSDTSTRTLMDFVRSTGIHAPRVLSTHYGSPLKVTLLADGGDENESNLLSILSGLFNATQSRDTILTESERLVSMLERLRGCRLPKRERDVLTCHITRTLTSNLSQLMGLGPRQPALESNAGDTTTLAQSFPSPLSLKDVICSPLLEGLATAYASYTDACRALDAVKFPTARRPARFEKPIDFWYEVCSQIALGVPPGRQECLMAQAARDYPDNPIFFAFREESD